MPLSSRRSCYTDGMARLKDEQKRRTIQQTAKMLFAQEGFYNTSVSDIVRESGFSVGTIYTYFSSKDDIVRSIVDEGWEEFRARLEGALAGVSGPEEGLAVVLDDFLPELLEDLELISILLTEAVQYTGIEEKVRELRELIGGLLSHTPVAERLSQQELETALMVYFLGILDSARLATSTKVSVKVSDILSLLRRTIEQALGVSLPRRDS